MRNAREMKAEMRDAPVTAEHSMRWPGESAAHRCYFGRIPSGRGYALAQAPMPATTSVA
jgi:hypothetical protein